MDHFCGRRSHPDLIIEFLVPERGRGRDKPYPLPQLGLNAQSLRYLDLLEHNSIGFKTAGLEVNLPHPAAFALHPLSHGPAQELAHRVLASC